MKIKYFKIFWYFDLKKMYVVDIMFIIIKNSNENSIVIIPDNFKLNLRLFKGYWCYCVVCIDKKKLLKCQIIIFLANIKNYIIFTFIDR